MTDATVTTANTTVVEVETAYTVEMLTTPGRITGNVPAIFVIPSGSPNPPDAGPGSLIFELAP